MDTNEEELHMDLSPDSSKILELAMMKMNTEMQSVKSPDVNKLFKMGQPLHLQQSGGNKLLIATYG